MTLATIGFVLLGLGAGALTTLAGQGGGLVLLLACSAIAGPHAALAITSPALLLGNLHRALLYRAHVDRRIAARMVLGALPGALGGGLLAGIAPAWTLRALLVGLTALAICKAIGLLRFTVPSGALVPAGAVVGAMTGAGGGAGVLFSPILLSLGLTGTAFVGTTSTVAFATHVGRVIGYAGLGLFERRLLGPTVAVALAIFAGNALGERIHRLGTARLGAARWARLRSRLEYGTLVTCVLLSVLGLG